MADLKLLPLKNFKKQYVKDFTFLKCYEKLEQLPRFRLLVNHENPSYKNNDLIKLPERLLADIKPKG